MRHLDLQPAMLHLRVGEHLRQVVDRPAGHAGLLQRTDPFGRGAEHRDLADQRNQLGAMGNARAIGGEAGIGRPLGTPGHLAELAELTVVANGEDDVAVGSGEILIGHDVRMGIAHAPGRHAGGEVIQRLVAEAGDLHVEQRGVDMLALAAAFAMCQRSEHANGGVQAGEDIGQRHADLHRPGALLRIAAPGQAHQPAEALDHEVVAGTRSVGAVLAETGDRAIDQPRIDRLQAFVIQPVGGQPADLEVLQQHIALRHQLADDALALGPGEVDGQRLLVAVGGQVIGGLRGVLAVLILEIGRAPVAGIVARAGALDLDHLGAEVAENLPAPGPGEYA